MQKLIIASNNQGKINEFANLLQDRFEVISLKQAQIFAQIEETAATFLENALIKARHISSLVNLPVLADDSGLCVDALGGAPGVYSARYSGENATDNENNRLLLANLKNVSDKSAHFYSCVVLYFPSGNYLVGEGKTYGKILEAPQGNGGFGYDPIFYSTKLSKSFGNASAQEKNSVSHRYLAVCDLIKKLNS